MSKTILVYLFSLSAMLMAQPEIRPADLSDLFEGMEGTFVLVDADGQSKIHNSVRAHTPFLPASTFKIPHTLIILETGLAEDETFTIPWDQERNPALEWWPRSWKKDQTLRSAFRNSVVWFYQETARRIGEHQMSAYLRAFNYGNQDMGGGIDQFWLSGDLRISPIEQVEFLQRVMDGRIRVSQQTRDMLRNIMLLDESDGVRIYGKTGTANLPSGAMLAWLVGFVEKDSGVSFYALNMEGETIWEDWPPQKRLILVQKMLARLGVTSARDE